MPAEEQILVVPTSLFHELGHFHGFCSDTEKYLPQLLDPQVLSFRPRSAMESDPSFKQLIPYALFQYRDQLFQYTRGKGQGEKRLHSRRSVGVGGHISLEDAGHADPYFRGLQRELEEEVEIGSPFQSRCVGLINDDESEVGRVHLGIVHIYELAAPRVAPREQDLVDAGFRPLKEILTQLNEFETWSQLCVKALYGDDA